MKDRFSMGEKLGLMGGQKSLEIAVIGGGISGLASAYFLARAGHRVKLFEASHQLGGLGTFFKHGSTNLERFYHCMLPADRDLIELLQELGLQERVYWKTAEFAFAYHRELFGLNTPLELLRFRPLSLADRIRTGVMALYASRCSAEGLDEVTSEQWLTRLCGHRAFKMFWQPMLEAKFGDRYREVPALWFWTRFNREKGTKREVKGYIRGGYKLIIDTLAERLALSGVELHLGSAVTGVNISFDGRPGFQLGGRLLQFDKVVSSVPLPVLREICAEGNLGELVRTHSGSIDYQGVINVVLLMKRKISKYYWVAAIGENLPFQGLIESSALLEPEDTSAYNLIYLMRYVHRAHPYYGKSDAEVKQDFVLGLQTLFPDVLEADILTSYIFRSGFVEPLYFPGYLRRKPPIELVPGRFYLVTSAQVYPAVTSWDSSVGLARKSVEVALANANC